MVRRSSSGLPRGSGRPALSERKGHLTIITRPPNPDYDKGWDLVFKKPKPACEACRMQKECFVRSVGEYGCPDFLPKDEK
jgi:hypothetical protein